MVRFRCNAGRKTNYADYVANSSNKNPVPSKMKWQPDGEIVAKSTWEKRETQAGAAPRENHLTSRHWVLFSVKCLLDVGY